MSEKKVIHWCGTCENNEDYSPEEDWVECKIYGVVDIPSADACPKYEMASEFREEAEG